MKWHHHRCAPFASDSFSLWYFRVLLLYPAATLDAADAFGDTIYVNAVVDTHFQKNTTSKLAAVEKDPQLQLVDHDAEALYISATAKSAVPPDGLDKVEFLFK